jgi:uncharacterized peroxidase-related enzyme
LRVEDGEPELVQAIKERRWRELRTLSDRDRALCAVAEKLSAQPTKRVKADWKPLRDLGFDDLACLEVAHIVGIFNHLTRLADGLGLRLDQQTLDASRTGRALKRPY